MTDLELTGDLADIDCFSLEGECRVPRDNMQRGDLAQIGDDVFADAIAEIFLFRIAAHIRERQHTDGRPLGLRRFICRWWSARAVVRLRVANLSGQIGIASLVGIEIEDVNAFAVFRFHFAKVMEMRTPAAVLLQIFGNSLRKQDVAGIAAIHDTLGHVDPHSSRIDSII